MPHLEVNSRIVKNVFENNEWQKQYYYDDEKQKRNKLHPTSQW